MFLETSIFCLQELSEALNQAEPPEGATVGFGPSAAVYCRVYEAVDRVRDPAA